MRLLSVSISFNKEEKHPVTIIVDRNSPNQCSCFICDGETSCSQIMESSQDTSLTYLLQRCMREHQYESFYDVNNIVCTYIVEPRENTKVRKITIKQDVQRQKWNVKVGHEVVNCFGLMIENETLSYSSNLTHNKVIQYIKNRYD